MDSENEFKYSAEETRRNIKRERPGFGRTVLIPFISGILGAGLVVGCCFFVPEVKEKIIGTSNNIVLEKSETKPTISTNTGDLKTVVDLADYSGTAVAVSEKALPSVVGINVVYTVSAFGGRTAQGEAEGSGIIISEDGYIVTNNHVISAESSSLYYTIEGAKEITVKLYNDDNEYKATVVGTDEYTDIAVLKIDKTGLTPATLGNSDNLKVGETVFAIGNPVGMEYSVTSGIVSAKDREVEVDGTTYTAIQTDAAINSGNSGGALVNANGEVIGINTLKLSGTGIEGIGFAIPISSATDIINQLIQNKTVKRPYIGIEGSAIDSYSAKRYNLPEGIYVESIEKDSPADKAGLKEKDIITKIEGTEVKTVDELNKIKNKHSIGDKVVLTVYRNGKDQEINLTLAEMPEQD